MKNGLVLFPRTTASRPTTAFEWWRTEAAKLGIELQVSFFEDIVADTQPDNGCLIKNGAIPKPDFVIMRGYNTLVSNIFEARGIPVFNRSEAMARSLDKAVTHQWLRGADIATPRTLCPVVPMAYEDALAELGSVFVAKQRDSSRGINVFLVKDKADYISALESCGANIILQEYIASSHGRDLRVWTIGNQAVACVLRHSDNSFLSNYSQGGRATHIPLDPAAGLLAARAAQTIGLDFAGIDLLFTNEGYTVCEVNGNAGFRTLSATSGYNIIGAFLKYIDTKVYG